MNIFEKLFGELKIKFSFLNRRNSPSSKASLKKSSAGNVAGRDINIGNESNEDISEPERKILHKLYLKYKETGQRPRLDLQTLHNEIGISEGDYIGPVNNSKFLKIDGSDYVIKDAGIRFMDSYVRKNKPEVDINSMAHSGSYRGQEITGLKLVNNGPVAAIGIECFLCADGLERIKFADVGRINPNEESRSSLGFLYSNTPFFNGPLENLRVVFEYKNKDGFKFISGRYLSQRKRDDGNYNIINSPLGDYFEN